VDVDVVNLGCCEDFCWGLGLICQRTIEKSEWNY